MRPIKYRQPLIDMRTKDFKGFHYWGYDGTTFTAPAATGGYANTGNLSDQFTGLLDKIGKEIYEGDIVKEDDMLAVCTFVEDVAAYAFVPVEIYPASFPCLFDEYGLDTFFRNDVPNKFVEVIGNIHENPEPSEAGE